MRIYLVCTSVVLILCIGMVKAQDVLSFLLSIRDENGSLIIDIPSDGRPFMADWSKVTECAKTTIVFSNPTASPALYCRMALAVREAVWLEAGRSKESNLFPAILTIRDNDIK
jgi:hypothetical protein